MKNTILAFTLLALTACGGRATKKTTETQFPLIGNTIGFIIYDRMQDSDTLNRIEILNDDGSVWHTVDMLDSEHNSSDFNPWSFDPGYGVFVVRCIAKSDNSYTVIVNEEKNIAKQLKITEPLMFQTIETHILERVLVGADFDTNPVRESPDDDAPTVRELNFYDISAEEMKGEWIRISDVETGNSLGWIRWKKGDRFMIGMHYYI